MANLPAISEADYDAIEGAVMETARGRWFLAEFAPAQSSCRHHHAAQGARTHRGRGAGRALGRAGRPRAFRPARDGEGDRAHQGRDRRDEARRRASGKVRRGDRRARTRSCRRPKPRPRTFSPAQSASRKWLGPCASRGIEGEVCDLLDAKATEVYTACSFQDLTGQRTRKVIGVLRYLEERINAMIEIWGLDGTMAREAAEARAVDAEKELLNGPAKPGQGLDQADVDMVMGPAAKAGRSYETIEAAPPLQSAYGAEVMATNVEDIAPVHVVAKEPEQTVDVVAIDVAEIAPDAGTRRKVSTRGRNKARTRTGARTARCRVGERPARADHGAERRREDRAVYLRCLRPRACETARDRHCRRTAPRPRPCPSRRAVRRAAPQGRSRRRARPPA